MKNGGIDTSLKWFSLKWLGVNITSTVTSTIYGFYFIENEINPQQGESVRKWGYIKFYFPHFCKKNTEIGLV